jgi:hypothetical protein
MSSLLQPEFFGLLLFSFAEGLVAARLGDGFWGKALFPQLALGWAISAFAYFVVLHDHMAPIYLIWLFSGLAANSVCVILVRRYLPLRKQRSL